MILCLCLQELFVVVQGHNVILQHPFLFGCQRLDHQRQNRHWALHKTDWQASFTFFMPPYTHQPCHSFQCTVPLQLRRICSTDETFTLRTNELMTYFHKRGYNPATFSPTRNRTFEEHHPKRSTFTQKCYHHHYTDKSECVPFIVTYNQTLSSISSIIRKHFSILTSPRRYHNIFCTYCCLPSSDATTISDSFL